ncbi:MAG TPA: hypothetical protein PKE47_08005 [Verrucomicrobiota bacterium]|nr:hypothetical protein [Verrucomicrobiota bacterium]
MALNFLSLPDLLRSKETERESDWQDLALLEEIHDARLLARGAGHPSSRVLAALRSQRGYATARAAGWLDEPALEADAWSLARHPVSAAFLAAGRPAAAEDHRLPATFGRALATAQPGTARHLALVEAVRRHWKAACVAADRADKERCLAD